MTCTWLADPSQDSPFTGKLPRFSSRVLVLATTWYQLQSLLKETFLITIFFKFLLCIFIIRYHDNVPVTTATFVLGFETKRPIVDEIPGINCCRRKTIVLLWTVSSDVAIQRESFWPPSFVFLVDERTGQRANLAAPSFDPGAWEGKTKYIFELSKD